jgi:hypothetical protein
MPEEVRARVIGTLQRQIDRGVRAGTLRPIAPDQFMANLMSLCIFPFAARPMIAALFGMHHHDFERFIERRRQELAPFFLRALRP